MLNNDRELVPSLLIKEGRKMKKSLNDLQHEVDSLREQLNLPPKYIEEPPEDLDIKKPKPTGLPLVTPSTLRLDAFIIEDYLPEDDGKEKVYLV